MELCRIYTLVYNKFHKSEFVIKMCKDIALPTMFSNIDLTTFACCVDEQYKPIDYSDINVVVDAYNKYYNNVKLPKAKANEIVDLYY